MSLSERILAVLSESPLPVSTPSLVAILGVCQWSLWGRLRKLEADGLVRQCGRAEKAARGPGRRATLWGLA